MSTSARKALGPLLMLGVCATGCSLTARPEVMGEYRDLVVTVEGIGGQPQGGLPDRLRLVVRNPSVRRVSFTIPRPLIDEQTLNSAEGEFVTFVIQLVDQAGHEEDAAFTTPSARSPAKPQVVVLSPKNTWTAEYPLAQFHFWGPCGPDTGGPIIRYFHAGDASITLRAVLTWQREDARIESNQISLRVRHEGWLFQRSHGI